MRIQVSSCGDSLAREVRAALVDNDGVRVTTIDQSRPGIAPHASIRLHPGQAAGRANKAAYTEVVVIVTTLVDLVGELSNLRSEVRRLFDSGTD
jgi:hypothetical protein